MGVPRFSDINLFHALHYVQPRSTRRLLLEGASKLDCKPRLDIFSPPFCVRQLLLRITFATMRELGHSRIYFTDLQAPGPSRPGLNSTQSCTVVSLKTDFRRGWLHVFADRLPKPDALGEIKVSQSAFVDRSSCDRIAQALWNFNSLPPAWLFWSRPRTLQIVMSGPQIRLKHSYFCLYQKCQAGRVLVAWLVWNTHRIFHTWSPLRPGSDQWAPYTEVNLSFIKLMILDLHAFAPDLAE